MINQQWSKLLFRHPRDRLPAPRSSAEVSPAISWVDEFIRNVKPYVFVRAEDNLLIKRPNQAYRLNSQGVKVLRFLLEGGSIHQLMKTARRRPRCRKDILLFLQEIRRCLDGSLKETSHTAAVEVHPLELNFSKLPVLSEVAVTDRCNLQCLFCYAGCSGGRTVAPEMEMTTGEIKQILEKIYYEVKVPSVSFTGGEPLLRSDLCELIRHAKELGLWVNLITNGTRITASVALELARARLDSAQVSLEGVTAGTHDAITGSAGSFACTVAAVKNLRQVGISVHTNTTLNRMNAGESWRMPHFVREELGLKKFSMNLVIPAGTAARQEDILIRYSDVGVVLEKILEASKCNDVEFMWYSPTPLCLFNPIVHNLGNKGCSACDGLLSVASNGDILPCSSWKEPLGNLLRDGFRTIWESLQSRVYRRKSLAHPECRVCEHFAVCHGACPLYWRHVGFDELCRQKDFGSAPEDIGGEFFPSKQGVQTAFCRKHVEEHIQ
jgi:radical SAM protein with 4Fe4S-binding SPASM domain